MDENARFLMNNAGRTRQRGAAKALDDLVSRAHWHYRTGKELRELFEFTRRFPPGGQAPCCCMLRIAASVTPCERPNGSVKLSAAGASRSAAFLAGGHSCWILSETPSQNQPRKKKKTNTFSRKRRTACIRFTQSHQKHGARLGICRVRISRSPPRTLPVRPN